MEALFESVAQTVTPVGEAPASVEGVGFVVIGRNEGERLKRCLASLQSRATGPIVYVDSGSTDGSLEYAEAHGVFAVALDPSRPFNMARARNVGFRELMTRAPALHYVQFVDGDCEVDSDWVPHAAHWLKAHPEAAAVCGHLRERFPHASVYNRLFDIETRGPYGDVAACGGVAMYRVDDFAHAGGFDESMIAGEEPELCLRLRRNGRRIWRSRQPMALHDADMHMFRQWWRRAVRCGHACADGFAKHGRTPARHNARAMARCLVYGLAVPIGCLTAVTLATVSPQAGGLALTALALQVGAFCKIGVGAYRERRSLGDPRSDSALYAGACVVSKTPEALGVLKFTAARLARRPSSLIEYRGIDKA